MVKNRFLSQAHHLSVLPCDQAHSHDGIISWFTSQVLDLTALGVSSCEVSDGAQFGEAEECCVSYYITEDLQENTDMGGQQEKGVKYSSFPAKKRDLIDDTQLLEKIDSVLTMIMYQCLQINVII